MSYSEIQKYIKMIKKGKILFLSISLLLMSIIVWGNYFLPKKYEASSTVFIERSVINEIVKGIAITPSMTDRIRVIRYAILSRGIMEKVLKDLDVDTKLKGKKMLDDVIIDFQERTNLTVKGDDLFIVTIRDPDPKLARDYINTLVRKYVEENISAKREESFGATRFIGEQLSSLKEKLDKAENKIVRFRQEQDIYLSVDEKPLVEEMKRYKIDIEGIKIKRKELIAVTNSIKEQLKGEDPFVMALQSKGKKESNIAILENKLKQLLVKYTENYPEVIRLLAEIDALKRQESIEPQGNFDNTQIESEMSTINPIYQELKQKRLQIEVELTSLDAKEKQLTIMIEERKKELRYLPEGKRKLSEMEKERDTYKHLYEQLFMRHGQSEVSKQMEIEDRSATFRIVDPAVLPIKPVSPNRPAIIIIGIVLGFLGGFGVVYLKEHLDSSVKEPQTIKDLGIAVLAIIPKIFNEKENRKRLKREILLYSVSAVYLLAICTNLILEIIGASPVESVIANMGLEDTIYRLSERFSKGF